MTLSDIYNKRIFFFNLETLFIFLCTEIKKKKSKKKQDKMVVLNSYHNKSWYAIKTQAVCVG